MITNGISAGLAKCENNVAALIVQIMSKGPTLFKNSHSRRKMLSDYFKSLDALPECPLISDLYQSMSIQELCDLYGIAMADNKSLCALDIFDDDQCEQIRLKANEVFNVNYLDKKCGLSKPPPRSIKNKWKTQIMAPYWWCNNIYRFVSFARATFDGEQFFSSLSPIHCAAAQMLLYYVYNKLAPALVTILRYEQRVPLIHWAYFDAQQIIAIWARPVKLRKAPQKIKEMVSQIKIKANECIDDEVAHIDEQLLADCLNTEDKIVNVMECVRVSMFNSFIFQFADTKKTLQLFKNAWNFNPFNPMPLKDILDATSQFKHGPNSWGNQPTPLKEIQIEYTHLIRVVYPVIQRNNEKMMKSVHRVIRRALKYNKLGGFVSDENKIHRVDAAQRDSDSESDDDDDIVVDSKPDVDVLSEKEIKVLKFYAKQGHKIDLVQFYQSRVMTRYTHLPKFIIDVTDHPVDTADPERANSLLANCNKNPLTKGMAPDIKRSKILCGWEAQLIESILSLK